MVCLSRISVIRSREVQKVQKVGFFRINIDLV